MKSRLTLLLLLIAFTTHAQDSYYHNQTQVGAGIGSNFVTIVGDNVKPHRNINALSHPSPSHRATHYTHL